LLVIKTFSFLHGTFKHSLRLSLTNLSAHYLYLLLQIGLVMKQIRVPYNGKGHTISYKVETIDLSMTPVSFMNVYSVFIDDEELKSVLGNHFTILQNPVQTIVPCYEVKASGNSEEKNLKKTIAQQIMNNPTE
jgi:hypothetical protein